MNNYITKNGAGGVGFEPTEVLRFNGFQGRRFRPLSQPPKTGVRHSTECAAPRAPRGIRTHTVQILSPLPLPIGLEEPAPPHMRGMCVLAWNRTKGLLIFNQALCQLSYKNLPATNRFLFTAGIAQVFLQTGNLGNRLVTLPIKSLASSSDACQYSGEADILKIRNVRKDVRK